MGKEIVNDLTDQFQRAFNMLYSEMERFDDVQWVTGISFFQVPVKQAMHIVDCLDFYFAGIPPKQYQWGHKFGGGWWELEDDQLPDQAALLEYTQEIEARVMDELASLQDEDFSRPYRLADWSGKTMLGHYVYALRHTMHHHGQLSALAVHHGNEGGSWE
jgi:uncharacterized damage-inducible protein DinB